MTAVGIVGIVVLLWCWYRLAAKRWADKVLEDFVEAFPGRCPICAYQRYGLQEGHTTKWAPPEHRCIEPRDDA